MENLELFNDRLNILINQSGLPLSVLEMCLQNFIFQINILKLKQEIEQLNKKEEIDVKEDNIDEVIKA